MTFLQCASGNYAPGRTAAVEYLVIHYTAGNGDTAQNNLRYFANNAVRASSHYFVDETECCQSVADGDTAWHCGAASYVHPACRNANSIGIELCSRLDSAGHYYFLDATVDNAVQLIREKMAEYGIDADHVVRHYDVTGKICPAPMVENETLWLSFKSRIAATEEEEKKMAEDLGASLYAQEAARWAVERGYFKGNGKGGYQWQSPLTREALAVILQRFAEANGLA